MQIEVVESVTKALDFASKFGYPIKVKPESASDDSGSGTVSNYVELVYLVSRALNASLSKRIQLTH